MLNTREALDVIKRILSEYKDIKDLAKTIDNSSDQFLRENKYLLLWLYDKLVSKNKVRS